MITPPLELNGKKYPVFIHLEDRDSSSVNIGRKGISIRLPRSISRDEMAKLIIKSKHWAKEQLEKNPLKEEIIKNYNNGDKLIVGDKEYLLSITYALKQSSSAKIHNNLINLNISSELPEPKQKEHISSLLSRIIAQQRLPELQSKIKQLNEKHFQAPLNKISFKKQKSRWGSCSSKGNINISTKLLFAPDDILESVCIHELAHLKEHNHSDRFWTLVERAMPNYKEKQQWLKQNGGEIGF